MSLRSGDLYRHTETKRHILLQELEDTHFSHKAWYVLWLDNGETSKVYTLELYSGVWRKVA